MRDHVIAVDVGTGSARAGVFDKTGALLARCERPILLHRPRDGWGEHDSEEIWAASCGAVRDALAQSGIAGQRVAAMAFDATCSLVLRGSNGGPLPLTETASHRFDTLAWLDHRATAEADECSRTGHKAVLHSGEIMSPEMEIPKLMWLKRHRPDLWQQAGLFLDLADFLTWKATGSAARSRCTLTAKWTYMAQSNNGWQRDFLASVGLEDLTDRGGLPDDTVPIGSAVGTLSAEAAAAFGLDEGIPVAAGMVDAYAGALGVLGSSEGNDDSLDGQVAIIGGTSSCIIAFAREPRFGRSLWGPYYESVFPEHWLVEAGQSATGGLLNHLLQIHSATADSSVPRHQQVIARILELKAEEGHDFAAGINILPDFHGNRSPFADPHMTGVISGLTLDTSFDGLCRLYWRACVAIALGLKQILNTMGKAGYTHERITLTGGHVKNPLLTQLYADVSGCSIVLPDVADAVLLGTAINAATAAGWHDTLFASGTAMRRGGKMIKPDPSAAERYERDYKRLLAMQRHRAELSGM